MTAATQSTPRSVFAMRDQVEILLVDDRAENLLALEAILEPLGQRLVRAQSGEEALRKLLTHDFAVVMLDVQMPGMNGFETAQLIKSRERTRYIPIIFLTAISKEEDYVFRGYQVGAVDYISKPFQPDVLRAKVAVFVDLHLKQKRLAEQESMLHEGERRMTELRHMRELLQGRRKRKRRPPDLLPGPESTRVRGPVGLGGGAASHLPHRNARWRGRIPDRGLDLRL
jgi:CheY-like chemotaxis protein